MICAYVDRRYFCKLRLHWYSTFGLQHCCADVQRCDRTALPCILICMLAPAGPRRRAAGAAVLARAAAPPPHPARRAMGRHAQPAGHAAQAATARQAETGAASSSHGTQHRRRCHTCLRNCAQYRAGGISDGAAAGFWSSSESVRLGSPTVCEQSYQHECAGDVLHI